MGEPGRMGLENALQGSRVAREPIVLTVVATGDNPTTGKHEVIFEDPDGVSFNVPSEWVDPVMLAEAEKSNGKEGFYHTDINRAPPGKLESIWRMATAQGGYDYDKNPGGFGGDDPAASGNDQTVSLLDKWLGLPEAPGWEKQYEPGGEQGPPVDVGDTEAMKAAFGGLQRTPAGWRPSLPPAKAPTIKRKEDIPSDAGSGWGNFDDVWNPKTQRWEKKRGSR